MRTLQSSGAEIEEEVGKARGSDRRAAPAAPHSIGKAPRHEQTMSTSYIRGLHGARKRVKREAFCLSNNFF